MGNLNSQPEIAIIVTSQTLQQSIKILKSQVPQLDFKKPSPSLYKAILTINQQFLEHGIYEIKQDNLTYINPTYLAFFVDPQFQIICQNWFKCWQELLQEISKSSTLLVKLKSWKFLSELTKLLICFSSDRVFYILNNITVLPLHPQSKQAISGYNPDFQQEPKGSFLMKLNRNEAQNIYNLSTIKTGHLSRPDDILDQINNFFQGCFVIFNRIYFSQNNYQQLRKRAIKINNQSNIEQVAYFLGYSTQVKNSSLFDISVLFAISLIGGGKTNPNIANLPSHLFKYLPTSPSNNIYNFILQIILFSLTQKKNQPSPRMVCNRFNALRLCHYIILYSLASLNEVTIDYIQNICVFTKLDDIERVFVVYLIQQILKIKETDHLKKYHTKLSKPFELLLANTKVKYECQQLADHFRKHEQFLLEEMQNYYYDYMQETILKRNRTKANSKLFWQRIINSKKQNRVTC